MTVEEIKNYRRKLELYNKFEHNEKRNYSPEQSVQRFFSLYCFGIERLGVEKLESYHKEHLKSLIAIQSVFKRLQRLSIDNQ